MKKSDAPEALLGRGRHDETDDPQRRHRNGGDGKDQKGLTWARLAKAIGLSKEMDDRRVAGPDADDERAGGDGGQAPGPAADAVLLLQQVPVQGFAADRGADRSADLPVSTNWSAFTAPLSKRLIHEEFGDGIMSAIDFKMDLRRGARSQGRPRQDRDERQVFAVTRLIEAAMFVPL